MKKRIIAAVLLATSAVAFPLPRSDQYIRDRVVLLIGHAGGSCSGEQVRAPSGKDYIISARHCADLADEFGNILVQKEDKSLQFRKVIAIDPDSDLLLIEGLPKLEGLHIGRESHRHQEIRTFTRGLGLPTYKTAGEIVADVVTPMLPTPETVITAPICPGSSGGAVVDSHGDLIGVASATNGWLFFMVRLQDIQHFLRAF